MAPELHRPMRVEGLGPGREVVVEASGAECAALAGRMGIEGLRGVRAVFDLSVEPAGVVAARITLKAWATQLCVVTLEPFEAVLQETAAVRFVPAGSESEDADPEAPDEIPYEGAVIDLGEAVAEQIALALDPYPRAPGAALPAEATEEAEGPFAALRALKKS